MKTVCNPILLNFQQFGKRNILASFDGSEITSNGGALILREMEKAKNFISKFAKCFTDYRDPDSIEHTVEELLSQRIFGICLGYEDLNDHDELRHDPLLAAVCGKIDLKGQNRELKRDRGKALAGKSTLNRLEMSGEGDLSKERYKKISYDSKLIEQYFIDIFLDSHKKEPEEIILDFDATDDPIHGNQEGSFFHGYYNCYCYLPLYIFSGDHFLGGILRQSNIDACAGTKEELERIVPHIRKKWPNVKIIVRGDSGFCRDEIMEWCEENDVYYLFGLAKNARLQKIINTEMIEAQKLFKETGRASRVFKDFTYQTLSSWSCERRVVGKAEHLEKGPNPRFVVTNIPEQEIDKQYLYEKVYCARGDMENRIKEQQLYLFADRTSSATMRANQLRLWFSSVAYVILSELRRSVLSGTEFEKSSCQSIRLKILKIGAQIKVSVRRIYISLSESYPYKNTFIQIMANIKKAYPLLC